MNPLIPNAYEVVVFYVVPLVITVVLAIVVYKLIKRSTKETELHRNSDDQHPDHDS